MLNVHEEYDSFTARLMGEWRYRDTYVQRANIQFEYIHLHCYLVKELDDIMLPESIVSDWSQYNESSKNYIKNKTHYRYNIQDMPEFSFTTSRFDYFHGGDAVVTEFPINDRYPSSQAGPIPGYERTIMFDGVEYNCNLYSTYIGETAYYYGNASLRTGDSANDTGEPFCWLHAPYSNQTWVITADTVATEHTISSGIIELKQLDEIYIPDTIARVANAEDENDALEMLTEMGILDPIQVEENNILTDEDGNIFTIE